MTAATVSLLERDGVLTALSDHLAAADTGRGRIVLLRGEAGVGKSALLRCFAERAGGRARILRGACDPIGTPTPLGPLLDMVTDLGSHGRRVVGEAGESQSVFRALLGELRCSSGPTLLLVEDLHWADGATLDLLRYLARRLGGVRVLVLGTYRDDEVGRAHPLTALLGDLAGCPTFHRLPVEPLSEAAVERMVSGTSLDGAALYRATGGNPFFVSEVVGSGSAEVPNSVSDLVLGRLARMPDVDRAVAELVAVVGASAEVGLIEALVPAARGGLASVLDHGLLLAVGDGLGFRHELARLAVLGAVPGYQRVALNRRVLAELRSRPDRAERLAHLAHHAEEAGDAAAVLEYAPAAGARASRLGAHAEAAAQYARALRHIDRTDPAAHADLLERHAGEAFLAGDTEAAITGLQRAAGLRRDLGDGPRLGDDLRRLAHALWPVGRLSEARVVAGEAQRVLEALPPGRELAELYLHRCMERSYHADVEGTRRFARLALELAGRLGDEGIAAQVSFYLSRARVGRTGRGWAEVARALDAVTDSPERAGFLHMTASSVAAAHRDRQGSAVIRDAEEYCTANDLITYLLATRVHGLLHPLHQGRWAEVADTAGEIIRHPRAVPMVRAPALAALGLVRARRGDPDAAAALDEAEGLLEPGFVVHMTPVWEARAEAAWLAGDCEGACAEARRGLAELDRESDPWLVGALARWVWLAGERPPSGPVAQPFALELAGDWRRAAEVWDELDCPYDAALARLSGDAGAMLRALEAFEALGSRPAADRARARLREFGIRSGNRGPRATTRADPHGLTERQRQILALVAQGLTDTQVAAQLHLSPKTVNHHVTAVLATLGVHSRADAVRLLAGR